MHKNRTYVYRRDVCVSAQRFEFFPARTVFVVRMWCDAMRWPMLDNVLPFYFARYSIWIFEIIHWYKMPRVARRAEKYVDWTETSGESITHWDNINSMPIFHNFCINANRTSPHSFPRIGPQQLNINLNFVWNVRCICSNNLLRTINERSNVRFMFFFCFTICSFYFNGLKKQCSIQSEKKVSFFWKWSTDMRSKFHNSWFNFRVFLSLSLSSSMSSFCWLCRCFLELPPLVNWKRIINSLAGNAINVAVLVCVFFDISCIAYTFAHCVSESVYAAESVVILQVSISQCSDVFCCPCLFAILLQLLFSYEFSIVACKRFPIMS